MPPPSCDTLLIILPNSRGRIDAFAKKITCKIQEDQMLRWDEKRTNVARHGPLEQKEVDKFTSGRCIERTS